MRPNGSPGTVLPIVRRSLPEISVSIVGSNPTKEITALAGDGVEVLDGSRTCVRSTPEVDSSWPLFVTEPAYGERSARAPPTDSPSSARPSELRDSSCGQRMRFSSERTARRHLPPPSFVGTTTPNSGSDWRSVAARPSPHNVPRPLCENSWPEPSSISAIDLAPAFGAPLEHRNPRSMGPEGESRLTVPIDRTPSMLTQSY